MFVIRNYQALLGRHNQINQKVCLDFTQYRDLTKSFLVLLIEIK
jgi:hypothetical protein